MFSKIISKFKKPKTKSFYELGCEAAMKGNMVLAYKSFLMDAKQTSRAKSFFLVGFFLYNGVGTKKNYNMAAELFKKVVESNLEAAFYLGEMYKKGQGCAKDLKKAFYYYEKAAEKGHVEAMFIVAGCYKTGSGVEKDDILAAEYYRKAAEKGHMKAQYNMAIMCSSGRGTLKCDEEAVEWYRKSAEQGYAIAQYNLGYMYHMGRGVQKNYKEALKWFKKASDNI